MYRSYSKPLQIKSMNQAISSLQSNLNIFLRPQALAKVTPNLKYFKKIFQILKHINNNTKLAAVEVNHEEEIAGLVGLYRYLWDCLQESCTKEGQTIFKNKYANALSKWNDKKPDQSLFTILMKDLLTQLSRFPQQKLHQYKSQHLSLQSNLHQQKIFHQKLMSKSQQELMIQMKKLEKDFEQEKEGLKKEWERELIAKDEKIREIADTCVQIADNSGKVVREKEKQIDLLRKENNQLKKQLGFTQQQVEQLQTLLKQGDNQCQLYKTEAQEHQGRYLQLKQETNQCMKMVQTRLGVHHEIGSIKQLSMRMEEYLVKTEEQIHNSSYQTMQSWSRPNILQNSRKFDSSTSGDRSDFRDRQQAKSLKKYESKIKDMKEKIEKYEKTIKILKQQNEKLLYENNQTRNKKIVDYRQSEINQLNDKINQLKMQISQSDQQISSRRKEVAKLLNENNRLRQINAQMLKQRQEFVQLQKNLIRNPESPQAKQKRNFLNAEIQVQAQPQHQKIQEFFLKQTKIESQLNRIGKVLQKNKQRNQEMAKVIIGRYQQAKNQGGVKQVIAQQEILKKLQNQCELKRKLLVELSTQMGSLEEKKAQFGVVENSLQRITIECCQRQKQLELLRSTIQREREVHLKQRQNYEKILERILKEINLVQIKLGKSKNQLEIKVADLEKTKDKLLQKKKQIQDIKTELNFLKNERQRSPDKPVQMQASTKVEENMISEPKLKQRYFESPAMLDLDETNFIVGQLLKANPHSRIKKVNLLHKYPLMQGSNPYDRIYDHPNYVVVVKLKNGMVVAMYSQIPLSARESHGRAFIASVTNRKAFPFREDCDIEHVVALHYSGHLIFGNGELCLGLWHPSYLKAEIHPDLRSFDTMGEKGPEVFVGNVSQKKYDVTDYEIFQIEFEEEEKK